MRHTVSRKRSAFTLVEVLIVVVILGILAATVIPEFTESAADAKVSATQQNLALMRSQIQKYKSQHEGRFPAAGETTEAKFLDHMLKQTDVTGATGTDFGPYVSGQLPPNPYNGLNTVTLTTGDLASGFTPDDTTGWVYSTDTGQFKANTPTSVKTPDGKPVFDL